MDNSLLARLGSLSDKERYLFYKRLTEVVNDKYSCFIYGGMNNSEYATMPKNKLEKLELNLYNEIFERVVPPIRIFVDVSSPNELLEKSRGYKHFLTLEDISSQAEEVHCMILSDN